LKVGRFAAKAKKAPASERARRLRGGKRPWRGKTHERYWHEIGPVRFEKT